MKKFFLAAFFCFLAQTSFAEAPKLTTTTFDGKKFDISTLKGKIVIVNFWAKWCSDCRREMPVLDELYKKYHAQGLEIIAISLDQKKQREDIKTYAAKYSYPNSMGSDVEENNFVLPKHLPTNYIMFEGKLLKTLDDTQLEMKDFEDVILPIIKMKLTK